MSESTDIVRNLYITGLRNQHAVENQAIELLQRQVDRLENYPEMSARMRHHIAESQEHARRLEELLAGLSSSHSPLKDAAMSFMGNMAALMHAPANDEVLKNTLANYAFEHFEIASYKSLLELADLSGHAAARTVLSTSLREEEAMAQWIDEHLAPTTRTFASRAAAGANASR
jgi:ferritin-like metal-binding protein YciE